MHLIINDRIRWCHVLITTLGIPLGRLLTRFRRQWVTMRGSADPSPAMWGGLLCRGASSTFYGMFSTVLGHLVL
jgi:hypothetical protein